MELSKWLELSRGRGIELARQISATPVLISQWGSGKRPVPIERCVAIERATAGAVTRRDLRPDDWADIWPEATRPDWRPVDAVEPATAGGG